MSVLWELLDHVSSTAPIVTLKTLADGEGTPGPDVSYTLSLPTIYVTLAAECMEEASLNAFQLAYLTYANTTFTIKRGFNPDTTANTYTLTGLIVGFNADRPKGRAVYDVTLKVKRTDVLSLITALKAGALLSPPFNTDPGTVDNP